MGARRSIDHHPTIPTWSGQNWTLTDKGFGIYKSFFEKSPEAEMEKVSCDMTLEPATPPNGLGIDSNLDITLKHTTFGEHKRPQTITEGNKDSVFFEHCTNGFPNPLSPSSEEYPDLLQMVSLLGATFLKKTMTTLNVYWFPKMLHTIHP